MSGDAVDAIPRLDSDAFDGLLEETEVDDAPAVVVRTSTLRERIRLASNDAGRDRRRLIPIAAYVGANGGGKSLAMVHDTIPSLLSGRRVLSTVALIDDRTGERFPNFEPLTDWAQLLELRHADLLLDEIVGIASSRESGGMPTQVANILMQLRRRDITMRWTAPAWARADKVIREVTKGVTLCSGHLPKPPPRLPDGTRSPRMWAENRLFRWRTFDATTFEEFTMAKADQKGAHRVKSSGNAWFWRPGSLAERSYRTLDDVSRVGEISDSGRCVHCSGRRVVPVCKCDDHEPRPKAVAPLPTPLYAPGLTHG